MKYFQQVLLISTYLLVSMQPSLGMNPGDEFLYAPPPRDSLPRSLPKETSQDTLDIVQEIRGSIRSQIDREERVASKPICVDALFLGPHGENADLFMKFVKEALSDHLFWRRGLHPEDPFRITEETKRSSDFLAVKDNLSKQLRLLLAELKKYSIPLYSMRHLGHMFGEQTIPSLVGYIATLLYNPNNVAFEGAPVTACLEEQVAKDLCQMIGYRIRVVESSHPTSITASSSDPTPIITAFSHPVPISWGHLTGGGTIANTEALWAARNVKFFPFSIQQVLKRENLLQSPRDVIVTLPNKEQTSLIDITDPWILLNIETDEVLQLPERIFTLLKRELEGTEKTTSFAEFYKLLSKYSIQEIGLLGVYELLNNGDKKVRSPVVLTSATRHYSFPKAVSLLGLGQESLIDIPVDENARINMDCLTEELDRCIKERRPIIAVAAIIGSTEEGAIDPLEDILQLRTTFREGGTDFHIHADAAWGGYFATLLQKPSKTLIPGPVPVISLSKHAATHLSVLKEADSVTTDPHKSGYMPYPAGALCYRNEDIINMVNFTAPYLSAQEKKKEPALGVYGIEGSKPGASAAMVYLTHRVIPLNQDGYGTLLGQALYSAKDFYRQLLALNTESNPFIVVPLAQPPSSETLQRIDDLRNTLIETVQYPHPSSKAQKRDLKTLRDQLNQELKEIGPDLNIVAYAFNFYDSSGRLNSDLDKANKFNEEIYSRLRPQLKKPTSKLDLVVSNTSLEKSKYGHAILEKFLKRLFRVDVLPDHPTPDYAVTILRSVIMNPWITETEEGSFVDTIMETLSQTVSSALKEMGIDNSTSTPSSPAGSSS